LHFSVLGLTGAALVAATAAASAQMPQTFGSNVRVTECDPAVGKDYGTFSPDAAIDHRLMIDQQIYPLHGPARCVVLGVRYADGATWTNPAQLQP
jgi:hypothetical protein